MLSTYTNRRTLIQTAQSRPVVKICGNLYPEDSALVASLGPDLMGWIFSPHSKRRVSVESAHRQIQSIRQRHPGIFHVAVFADNSVPEIRAIVHAVSDFDFVQAAESPSVISELKNHLRTEVDIIPAVRVSGKISDKDLAAYMPVDWCILDTAVPGTFGGTGKTLDLAWVSDVRRRHLLAGGLTPDNVAERLRNCSASGADVSSGVETDRPGRKDPGRVRAFISAVKGIQFAK